MDQTTATAAFLAFLDRKQVELDTPLAQVPNAVQRVSAGWAFFYQSEEFVATGAVGTMLIGHGPVVIHDDGRIIEGGALDQDPEALLLR